VHIVEQSWDFRSDESGVALSEYLIMLSLILGAVLVSVAAVGVSLGSAYTDWSTFFLTLLP